MERYPRLVINFKKLKENLTTLSNTVHGKGATLSIVTKVLCADPKVAEFLIQSRLVDYLSDSRIQNLKTYWGLGLPTMLLRLPQKCEIAETVSYADISCNSEIETIRLLDAEAERQKRIHGILLMIDLGDLREGILFKDEEKILKTAGEIIGLKNIKLEGVGSNLGCYGGVLSTNENLSVLVNIKRKIEEHYRISLTIVSGGNTGTYYLIGKGQLPEGMNNFRLGESFVLGNDTSNASQIPGTCNDAITLEAQIIEIQTKPSVPIGEIGLDAFGDKPVFTDRGIMKRAICAVGKQDIDTTIIFPIDQNIQVMGSSSDHLILDITKTGGTYNLGDTVAFTMNYGALLRAFTSSYVSRHYIPLEPAC